MQVWIPGEARKQQEMATNKGHGEQELWPGYGHGCCEETPRQVPQPHGNPVTADAYTQTHGALWPQEPINQELDEHEHHHPHFIHSSSAILP